MSRLISRFIEYCDIISYKPTFLTKGNPRFTTIYGGIMSMMIYLFSIIAFSYFFSRLISRQNPSVYVNTGFSQEINGTFQTQDYLFMFNLFTMKRQTFPNQEKMFAIDVANVNYTTSIDKTTGRSTQILQLNMLNITKCNKDILKDYINYLGDYNYQDYYCLLPNQTVNFKNTPSSLDFYYYYNIYFSFCQNSSVNNNSCLPQSNTNSLLSSYFAEFITLDYFIDHNNYTNPLQKYAMRNYDGASANFYMKRFSYYNQFSYTSDNGIFMENLANWNGKTIGSNQIYSGVQISAASTVPWSFFLYSFQFNSINMTYVRAYDRLQTILAQIGGFINVIYIFSEFIISSISTKHFFLSIFLKSMKLVDLKNLKQEIIDKSSIFAKNRIEFKQPKEKDFQDLRIEANTIKNVNLDESKTIVNLNLNEKTLDMNNYKKFKMIKFSNFIGSLLNDSFTKKLRIEEFIGKIFFGISKNHVYDLYFDQINKKIMKCFEVETIVENRNDIKILKKIFSSAEIKLIHSLGEYSIMNKPQNKKHNFSFSQEQECQNELLLKILDNYENRIGKKNDLITN